MRVVQDKRNADATLQGLKPILYLTLDFVNVRHQYLPNNDEPNITQSFIQP